MEAHTGATTGLLKEGKGRMRREDVSARRPGAATGTYEEGVKGGVKGRFIVLQNGPC